VASVLESGTQGGGAKKESQQEQSSSIAIDAYSQSPGIKQRSSNRHSMLNQTEPLLKEDQMKDLEYSKEIEAKRSN
jgi:hypothetical protein